MLRVVLAFGNLSPPLDNWRTAMRADATDLSQARTTRQSVADVVERSGWVLTCASCDDMVATEATVRIPESPLTYTQVDEVSAPD